MDVSHRSRPFELLRESTRPLRLLGPVLMHCTPKTSTLSVGGKCGSFITRCTQESDMSRLAVQCDGLRSAISLRSMVHPFSQEDAIPLTNRLRRVFAIEFEQCWQVLQGNALRADAILNAQTCVTFESVSACAVVRGARSTVPSAARRRTLRSQVCATSTQLRIFVFPLTTKNI